MRIQDFPFRVTNQVAVGTDAEGEGRCWVALNLFAIYKGPLTFQTRREIRDYALERARHAATDRYVEFNGQGFGATPGHPAHAKLPRMQADNPDADPSMLDNGEAA